MELSELPIDVLGPPAESVAVCEPARLTPDDERTIRIASVGFDYAAQPKVGTAECNLCGAAELLSVETKDRYGFDVELAVCSCCGLVFINPRMSAGDYAEFYAGSYRALVAAYSGQEIVPELLEAQQAVYAGGLMQAIAPYLAGRAGQEYLDIGGSTGVIAGSLKGAFALGRTLVLDPCESELASCKARGCVPFHCTAEGLQTDKGAGSFGVITMLQTADHLLDVAHVLETVRTLIHPKGVFVVDIVNFAVMFERYGLQHSIKIDHVFSLTPETFEAYLLRAGFAITDSMMSGDGRHVFYVCTPSEKQSVLPEREYVAKVLLEIGVTQ